MQESLFVENNDIEGERAMAEAVTGPVVPTKRTTETEEPPRKKKKDDDPVSEGIMAALNKLRKDGG